MFGVKAQLTSGVAHALFSLFADRCPYMASSSFFISGPTEVVEQKSRSDTLEAEARPAMMAPPSATGSASPEGMTPLLSSKLTHRPPRRLTAAQP